MIASKSMDKQIRVFIEGSTVRRIEDKFPGRRNAPGRPSSHTTCTILAMLGVREFLGIGYRETNRIFKEAGYAKLPDFRTLSWRAHKLKSGSIRLTLYACETKDENWVIMQMANSTAQFMKLRSINVETGKQIVRKLGTDYIELAV